MFPGSMTNDISQELLARDDLGCGANQPQFAAFDFIVLDRPPVAANQRSYAVFILAAVAPVVPAGNGYNWTWTIHLKEIAGAPPPIGVGDLIALFHQLNIVI